MAKPNLITHPETGETLSQTQWAKKIGISSSAFSSRLKEYPLLKALTPGCLPPSTGIWSPEEDEYLGFVYRAPSLHRRWNKVARLKGWKQRTYGALGARIHILQHQGILDSRRKIDESDGWVTMSQLSSCLGICNTPVKDWIDALGLKAYRDGKYNNAPYKIHLKDFVEWACTPTGAGRLAKAIQSDALAASWLLVQIGCWLPEVRKSKNHLKIAS